MLAISISKEKYKSLCILSEYSLFVFVINIPILQGWKALSNIVLCILGYLKGLRGFLIILVHDTI